MLQQEYPVAAITPVRQLEKCTIKDVRMELEPGFVTSVSLARPPRSELVRPMESPTETRTRRKTAGALAVAAVLAVSQKISPVSGAPESDDDLNTLLEAPLRLSQ